MSSLSSELAVAPKTSEAPLGSVVNPLPHDAPSAVEILDHTQVTVSDLLLSPSGFRKLSISPSIPAAW